MPLSRYKIDEIDETHLRSLIENEIPEGKSIEYKMQLPGSTDEDKKEFLADLSSFANTIGGDIIYGIKEEDGKPASLEGLNSFDLDKTKLWAEDLIRIGLKPRLYSIQFTEIKTSSGGVLLIRIPRSWNCPHVLDFKNRWRFYGRNSAGKFPLEIDDVRSMFIEKESFQQKLESFRYDRINNILKGKTPIDLVKNNPVLLINCVPIDVFRGSALYDLKKLNDQKEIMDPICDWHGAGQRFSFDGLVRYANTHNGKRDEYQLFFRNGCYEYVTPKFMVDYNNKKCIAYPHLGNALRNVINKYKHFCEYYDIPYPLNILVNLIGIKGYTIIRIKANSFEMGGDDVIREDNLLFPPVMIENPSIKSEDAIKSILDSLWNACNYAFSWHYDQNGNWIENPR